MSLEIVILAAGQGKRMYSALPKVLHAIAGKPMLQWVIDTGQTLQPKVIHVIYGQGGEEIKQKFSSYNIHWIHQKEQLGTGHALLQALPFIDEKANVLILNGDVPLIQSTTLNALLQNKGDLNLLLAHHETPTGFGRISRNHQGDIQAVIEEKDATAEQKKIQEIYTGVCWANARDLKKWLPVLNNNNAQNEYYLTDLVAIARKEGKKLTSVTVNDSMQIQGVNNRLQLVQLERDYQKRVAENLLCKGVQLADMNRIDIRGELLCGQDVYIDINVVFIGRVEIGDGCIIGPNCVITDVKIGKHCHIEANSVLEKSLLGDNCHIGPFARLRAGTQLGQDCKIGNFVETKNVQFGVGSKANHLSYLGDATLGNAVNIGAGTITCNYDGANKHKTVIGDGAFIGSDTQLIAPVSVGENATIGAGSTIRKDVPAGELTLTISQQKTVRGWQRPVKKSTETIRCE